MRAVKHRIHDRRRRQDAVAVSGGTRLAAPHWSHSLPCRSSFRKVLRKLLLRRSGASPRTTLRAGVAPIRCRVSACRPAAWAPETVPADARELGTCRRVRPPNCHRAIALRRRRGGGYRSAAATSSAASVSRTTARSRSSSLSRESGAAKLNAATARPCTRMGTPMDPTPSSLSPELVA